MLPSLKRALTKSERGAALMLALFATTLLMVIATEIMYETSVEYVVSSQAVNKVRSYWAARAGVEISLLRIQIFKQAQGLAGKAIPDPSILDEIWRHPFLWPPPIPKETSIADKDQIQKAVKSSDMTALKASYFATIESEGAKIDINDLGSPSKIMADAARNQLLQIFNSKVENDDEFSRRFRGFDFQAVLNNIADWIDADKTSRNSGDEAGRYSDRGGGDNLPPNQPIKTMAELHQVAEMTDELYDLIAPAITLYGSKGINVNQAKKEVFLAFGPSFNIERVNRILADRQDPKRGPFKNEKDFVDYLNSIGITGNPFESGEGIKVPLVFEPESNFRIRATGKSGQAQTDIIAVVYDQERTRARLEKALVDQATKGKGDGTDPTQNQQPADPSKPPPTATPKPEATPAPPAPLRRPKIVYWNED